MSGLRIERLVYVSRSLIAPYSADLLDIVRASQRNNPRLDLTGALYFDAASFLQVLEGPGEALDLLWGRLLGDDRHIAVRLLDRGPADRRRFAEWRMKMVDGPLLGRDRAGFDWEAAARADRDGLARLIDTLVGA